MSRLTGASETLLEKLYRDGGGEPIRASWGWEYEDTEAALALIEAEARAPLEAVRAAALAREAAESALAEWESTRYGPDGAQWDAWRLTLDRLETERALAVAALLAALEVVR